MKVNFDYLNESVMLTSLTMHEFEAVDNFVNEMITNMQFLPGIGESRVTIGRQYTLGITKIVSNDGAIIVFFNDKTKVIVKRMPGDADDIYAAVAQAICKKIYGGTSSFHKMVDQKLEDFRSPLEIKNQLATSFNNFFTNLWRASHNETE